jgi:hypothetical protein
MGFVFMMKINNLDGLEGRGILFLESKNRRRLRGSLGYIISTSPFLRLVQPPPDQKNGTGFTIIQQPE